MSMDVIIIGAGTGGLITALKLAENGTDVTLFEKSPEETFGNTWCNYVEVSGFQKYGFPIPKEDEVAFDPYAPVDYRTTDDLNSMTIEHFDHYLLKMSHYQKRLVTICRDKGVDIQFGQAVEDFIYEADYISGVVLKGSGKKISAKLVVVASGSGALPVKNPADEIVSEFTVPESETVTAIQELWEIDKEMAEGDVAKGLLPDRDIVMYTGVSGPFSTLMYQLDIKKGLFGVLAGSRIQDESIISPRKIIDNLIAGFSFCTGRIYGGGRTLPIRNAGDSMVANGLVVIGDAACMASPVNGSGTLTSMIAGKLCAETAVQILKKGQHFSKENLWEINYKYQVETGSVLAGFYVSQKMIRTLTEKDVQNTIKYNLLRPEDVVRVHSMQPVKIGFFDGISRAINAIPVIGLLVGFLGTGIRIQRIMSH